MANDSASTPALSLYGILTEFHSEHQHHATSLILFLLQAIAHDTCVARRNTHSLYSLVSDARDAYDHLNKLIDQIESDNELATWDVFDEYTEAIEPFEDLLFDLAPIAENESQYFANKSNLEACIGSVEVWSESRMHLRQIIGRLRKIFTSLFAGRTHFDTCFHDDHVFLCALDNDIKQLIAIEDWPHNRPDIQAIQGGLHQITDALTGSSTERSESGDDNFAVKTVRFAMLIHGVLELACSSKTDSDIQFHLRSPEVWLEAKKFLDALITSKSSCNQLITEWSSLLAFLRSNSIVAKLPAVYPNLRKQVAKIRRPYYSQALVLVNECRLLAEAFTSQSNKWKAQELIERVFADAEMALQSAAQHPASHELRITSTKSSSVENAFKAAQKSVEDCMISFQNHKEWTEWKQRMDKAKQRDNAQLEAFEKRLEKADSTNPGSKTSKKVSIEFYTLGPDKKLQRVIKVPTATHDVETSTNLSAVQWYQASLLEDQSIRKRILDPRSYFISAKMTAPHPFNTKVESLPVNNNGVSALALVIPN